jgi:hypothetical protein
MVSEDYVSQILAALQFGPDAVGFKVNRYVNGRLTGLAVHTDRFKWNRTAQGGGNWYQCDRVINHLNPVKTEIARRVRFPESGVAILAEDIDYATRLKASGLIKREVFLDKVVYDYMLISKKEAVIA